MISYESKGGGKRYRRTGGYHVKRVATDTVREEKEKESPTQRMTRLRKEVSEHILRQGLRPGVVVRNKASGQVGRIARIDGITVYLEGSRKRFSAAVFEAVSADDSAA